MALASNAPLRVSDGTDGGMTSFGKDGSLRGGAGGMRLVSWLDVVLEDAGEEGEDGLRRELWGLDRPDQLGVGGSRWAGEDVGGKRADVSDIFASELIVSADVPCDRGRDEELWVDNTGEFGRLPEA